MNRKILTKIRLINWHYFEDETIEVENSVLFFGDNGSGKSTILDAIQYVLTGNGKKFNKAANEKGTRDLKGYVRCKTGEESKTYKRTGVVTSFVALEFFEESKKRHFVVGVKLDSQNEEDSVKRSWFIEECDMDDIVFIKDKRPVSSTDFTAKGKKIALKKTDEEGNARILQRLGNLDPQFRELIPRSLAFVPMSDVKDFIKRFFLAEKAIEIGRLKQDLQAVKEMDEMIQAINREIKALHEICNLYENFQDKEKEILTIDILLNLATYHALHTKIDTLKTETASYRQLLERAEREIEQQDIKEKDLQIRLSQVRNAMASNDAQKLVDNLTMQEISERRKEDNLRIEAEKFEKSKTTVQKLFLELNRELSAFDLIERAEDEKTKLDLINGLLNDIEKIREKTRESDYRIRSKLDENENKLRAVRKQIENLQRNQHNYHPDVLHVKNAIETEFQKRGIGAPVSIVCEQLEITIPEWRNAIEGYLNTQKFNLVVKPEHYDLAIDIYHSLGDEVSHVGIVDTTKLVKDDIIPERTLACFVDSANPYVKRYVQFLLKNVFVCDDIHELNQHKVAITKDCMLYKSLVIRRLDRSTYDTPYIGKAAIKTQLTLRQKELKRLEEEEQNLKAKLNGQEELYRLLQNVIASDLREYYGAKDMLKATQKEIRRIKAELEKAKKDKSLLLYQEQLSKLETEQEELRKIQRENYDKRADYKSQIERRESEVASKALELTQLELLLQGQKEQSPECFETAQNKYRTAEKKNDSSTIHNNYTPRRVQLNREKTEIDRSLTSKQTMYNQKSNTDYPIGSEPVVMYQYFDRLQLLEKTKLVECEGKLTKRREECEEEFKTSFLAKLKENIEEAHFNFLELNKILSKIDYNGNKYKFHFCASKEKKALYGMIMDDSNIGGITLFTQSFETTYRMEMSDLFGKLMTDEDSKVLDEYTDYRNYMDYDIEVYEGDRKYSLSKNAREKSGGESQVPYYVIIAASFNQIYKDADTVRLIMLDEAFDKMDEIRMQSMMEFFNNLGFQMILATPPGKVNTLGEWVNSIFLTIREADSSTVDPYYL